MRFTLAAKLFVCFAVVVAGDRLSQADQVDDLFAGKAINVEAAPAGESESGESGQPAPATAESPAEMPAHHSLQHGPVPERNWQFALDHSDQLGQGGVPASEEAAPPQTGVTGAISLVPEPSTIALAAGALVYFLIFFRRRYSF